MNEETQTPHGRRDNEFDADLIAPVSVGRKGRGERPVRKLRRHRWMGITSGAALVTAVVVGVWVWPHLRPGPKTPGQEISKPDAKEAMARHLPDYLISSRSVDAPFPSHSYFRFDRVGVDPGPVHASGAGHRSDPDVLGRFLIWVAGRLGAG